MEGGPPSFTPDYSGRALLRNSTRPSPSPSSTGLSPSRAPRSRGLPLASLDPSVGPTTPGPQGPWFGRYRFRSPLLPASQLIPLPPGTEMFQFPGFASLSRVMTTLTRRRVAPFGHPRINACVPLPLAYRSLPRPSSPLCAQASSTCYRSLDYILVAARPTGHLPRPPHDPRLSQAEHANARRAVDRRPAPSSSLLHFPFPATSRVSTQNSDQIRSHQLFACSCDSISHDLPFVSVVK